MQFKVVYRKDQVIETKIKITNKIDPQIDYNNNIKKRKVKKYKIENQ